MGSIVFMRVGRRRFDVGENEISIADVERAVAASIRVDVVPYIGIAACTGLDS